MDGPPQDAQQEVVAPIVSLSETCAVGGDGRVACWGLRHQPNKAEPAFDRTARVVPELAGIAAASGPFAFLTTDGRAITWDPAAATVGDVAWLAGDRLVQLEDGWARTASGAVRWRREGDRELPAPAVHLAVGSDNGAHACAALQTGVVHCWGSNGHGQAPPVVAGVTDAIEVAAGSEHSCALSRDGTVRCWGSGYQGNLGIGDAESSGPVRVPDVSDARAIFAGGSGWTTCVVRESGQLTCWGGSGDWFPREAIEAGPVDIPGATDVVAVDLVGSGLALCYATAAGEVRCAGHSHYEDAKGRPQWGSYPNHREVFYGDAPTIFRVVLPAESVW